MISIHVRDFRGAERVDIECAPIALLAGRNANGKTSVCQAVAAALTGKTLPIGGMSKGDAGALVRVGMASGAVTVAGEGGGLARVVWPACTRETDGEPPHASEAAAGLFSLVDQKPQERAQFLAGLLRSDPTREDFAAAMTDKGLGDSQIVAPMWKLVCDKGWDAAHALRKEKGAELKGQWRQITGQNYGSAKAASYHPANWSDDLATQTDRELDAAVTDARAAHHREIAAQAAGGARREILEAEAGKLNERGDAVEAAVREMTAVEDEATRLRADLAAAPIPGESGMRCPHCGGMIAVVQRNLAERALEKAPPPLPDAELKERRRQRAELSGALSNAESRASAAKQKLNASQASLDISRQAGAQLTKLPQGVSDAGDAADAEAAVTQAEQRLAAFKAKNAADDIRDRIASNELVIEILAPDGLRARKLAKVLELFNTAQLAPLCEEAGWKAVEVSPDMTITYGRRDFRLCSASEQYRVRAVLQVAIAKRDGSQMLVLDAADILDAPTRSGLFSMLVGAELPALVALTLSKREQVPDLAAAGLGASFWIEGGIAEPIGQAAQREAA